MHTDAYGFSVNPVIEENLRSLALSLKRESDLRLCEWASLAEGMADAICRLLDDGFLPSEAVMAFIASLPDDPFLPDDTQVSSVFAASERASLCCILTDILKERGHALCEGDFLPREDAMPVVAYVKNPYADEAYSVFAEEMPDLTVRYASSFDEVVRQLVSGEVGYCLLPLEESGGLRLSTVERLMHAHDLRIARVTPVFGPDGTADLRYALVCQSVSATPYQAEDDRYLELRLPLGADAVLTDLFIPAHLLSFSVYRVQTVSFGTGEDRDPYLSAVLCGQGADFTALLLYLAMFCREAVVVGLYRNLES